MHHCASSTTTPPRTLPVEEFETNHEILEQRLIQIAAVKTSMVYQEYSEKIPKNKREPADPTTPRAELKLRQIAWESTVRRWENELSKYGSPLPNWRDESSRFSDQSDGDRPELDPESAEALRRFREIS